MQILTCEGPKLGPRRQSPRLAVVKAPNGGFRLGGIQYSWQAEENSCSPVLTGTGTVFTDILAGEKCSSLRGEVHHKR